MVESEFERVDPLWASGNYLFQEQVNDESCARAMKFIQWHNMKNSSLDHLTLVFNTPGGSVSSAMALVDVMKTSKIPVNTLAVGSIASCGVILTMSGKHRQISENCQVMSHQYSWGKSGKHADLMANRKAEDMTHELLIKHYMKCTKKSRSYIEKHLLPHHDVWMTAQEAVDHGIVDEVRQIY